MPMTPTSPSPPWLTWVSPRRPVSSATTTTLSPSRRRTCIVSAAALHLPTVDRPAATGTGVTPRTPRSRTARAAAAVAAAGYGSCSRWCSSLPSLLVATWDGRLIGLSSGIRDFKELCADTQEGLFIFCIACYLVPSNESNRLWSQINSLYNQMGIIQTPIPMQNFHLYFSSFHMWSMI